MDKIRIVLVTAFALISFMLLIEFSKFRDEKNKQVVESTQKISTQTKDESKPSLTVTPSNTDEIPSIINDIDNSKETTPSTNQSALIEIHTDYFFILIDPKGGDIVHLALNKFLARLDTPTIPFVLLEDSQQRSYIAQSGLIGKNGTDVESKRPMFTSAAKSYVLTEGKNNLIVDLQLIDKGITIVKRFTFYRGNYLFDIDYLINNESAESWEASYFAQIKRDNSENPASDASAMGMMPYLGFATRTEKERFKKIDFADIESKPFKENLQNGWIGLIQHYFLSAWIPTENVIYEYSTIKSKSGFYFARIKGPVTVVAAGQKGEIHSSFYAGPKDQYTLAKISEGLDLSVDYGVLWMIAQPLYALMYFFNLGELHLFDKEIKIFSGINNWGFSIILLTIFVKLLLFPLNQKAYSSMAKMRLIQPKMLDIKDRFADDKQRQSKEMMDLYKNEGVNPLGGCLPMLIQMPVFMALYWVLLETVELRHAPFIGYIHDLSAMDPYFIMPIIMGATMYIQQQLNPPPPDPMQAKVMKFLPIIFTFFFLFFPSGLVLYWIVNNILSIAQQWYITKKLEEVTTK